MPQTHKRMVIRLVLLALFVPSLGVSAEGPDPRIASDAVEIARLLEKCNLDLSANHDGPDGPLGPFARGLYLTYSVKFDGTWMRITELRNELGVRARADIDLRRLVHHDLITRPLSATPHPNGRGYGYALQCHPREACPHVTGNGETNLNPFDLRCGDERVVVPARNLMYQVAKRLGAPSVTEVRRLDEPNRLERERKDERLAAQNEARQFVLDGLRGASEMLVDGAVCGVGSGFYDVQCEDVAISLACSGVNMTYRTQGMYQGGRMRSDVKLGFPVTSVISSVTPRFRTIERDGEMETIEVGKRLSFSCNGTPCMYGEISASDTTYRTGDTRYSPTKEVRWHEISIAGTVAASRIKRAFDDFQQSCGGIAPSKY